MSGGVTRQQAAEGAERAWVALRDRLTRPRRGGGLLVREGPGRAPLWPVSQVLHAAVLRGQLREAWGQPDDGAVAAVWAGVGDHRTARGWTAEAPPALRRTLYYDDDAWLGLAAVQGGTPEMLDVARQCLAVVRAGEDPRGGVRWSERTAARHACSTGPGALLALRLARGPATADVAGFVARSLAFLDRELMTGEGLVADHVDAGGRVEPRVWSYNQGAALGTWRLAGEVLDDPTGRARATGLGRAVLRHYADPDRLWLEPPAFVGILLRQLLALAATEGSAEWLAFVDRYLARLLRAGIDPGTGLVGAGGIGRYDRAVALDQAAMVAVLALRALPADRWAEAC